MGAADPDAHRVPQEATVTRPNLLAAIHGVLYSAVRYYCHRCDRILWTWQKCQHHPRFWRG